MDHEVKLVADWDCSGCSLEIRDPMKIIINADDFGNHLDIDNGILRAYRYGVVTSTSLMVNFEASAEAARMATEDSSLAVGLHFNVTSGRCTAIASQVPLLAHSDGQFSFDSRDVPGSMGRWRTMITSDSRILDQIEREFWAQVERFCSFGLKPSHLDVHHYLALIHIDLFAKYVALANQLAVPFRALCYPMIDMLHIPQSVLAEMKAMVQQSRSPSPQISLSNLLGGRPAFTPEVEEYERIVETRLNTLAREGVDNVELITHPAHITQNIRQHDDYVWARELETALVNSPSFAQFLKSNDYSLLAHTDLK